MEASSECQFCIYVDEDCHKLCPFRTVFKAETNQFSDIALIKKYKDVKVVKQTLIRITDPDKKQQYIESIIYECKARQSHKVGGAIEQEQQEVAQAEKRKEKVKNDASVAQQEVDLLEEILNKKERGEMP